MISLPEVREGWGGDAALPHMSPTTLTPLFLSIALLLAVGGTAGALVAGGALLLLLVQQRQD